MGKGRVARPRRPLPDVPSDITAEEYDRISRQLAVIPRPGEPTVVDDGGDPRAKIAYRVWRLTVRDPLFLQDVEWFSEAMTELIGHERLLPRWDILAELEETAEAAAASLRLLRRREWRVHRWLEENGLAYDGYPRESKGVA